MVLWSLFHKGPLFRTVYIYLAIAWIICWQHTRGEEGHFLHMYREPSFCPYYERMTLLSIVISLVLIAAIVFTVGLCCQFFPIFNIFSISFIRVKLFFHSSDILLITPLALPLFILD